MSEWPSAEEMLSNQYNAVMRELSIRKEEIIGGRLDCLNKVDIAISLDGWEEPHITITRDITAVSDIC